MIVNNSANSLSKSSHRIIAFALSRVKLVSVNAAKELGITKWQFFVDFQLSFDLSL